MSKSLENLNGIEIISSSVKDVTVPETQIIAHDDVRLELLHDDDTYVTPLHEVKPEVACDDLWRPRDDVTIDGFESNGCIIPESKLHKLPYDLPPKRSHSKRSHSKHSHSKRSHSNSRRKKRTSYCDEAPPPPRLPESAAGEREQLSSKDRKIARLIGVIAGMLMLSAFVIVGVALSMSSHIDQMGRTFWFCSLLFHLVLK